MLALSGVGDRTRGQWFEWTGRAFHVRRRLSEREGTLVGPAIDCRGTDEWQRRYDVAAPELPAALLPMALQERTP